MTKPKPRLVLSDTRLIPFNKFVLSQANVHRVSNGVSIEDLAEDIGHRLATNKLKSATADIAAE